MRVAFYKGKGRFLDRAIKWWTGSGYSHCELVFSDGKMFSADAWEGVCRFRSGDLNTANWDFVEVHMDTFDENKLKRWCHRHVGKKYDWVGILFAQIFPAGLDSKDQYFCSEVCVEALQLAGKLPGLISHEISPGKLAKIYGLE